ncbi:MAG: hypothetical protein ABI199_08430 [Bacteroidia bacterium]
MDRTIVKNVSSAEEAEMESIFWIERSVEERYYAIEFLRAQWIEMNQLSPKMDRTYFEYR